MRVPLRPILVILLILVLPSCGGGGGGEPGTHLVRYEVEGGMGIIDTAEITYNDETGRERTIEEAPLPWFYSFWAEPDDALSLEAVLHGELMSNTLYATIRVDSECYVEMRTFVIEQAVSVSGTPEGILTSCPNHGGTTEIP